MAGPWIRVKDTSTKHEYTIHEMSYVEGAHEKLDKKDAVDSAGVPLPPKPHVTPSQAKAIKESEGNG